MTGGEPKHCELCDLPLAQCAHGLAPRPAKTQRPQGKKKARGAARPVKGSGGSTGVPGRGTVRVCAECGERARYGRYRLCLPCGIRAGFRVCASCGRYFQPEAPVKAKKKAKCKTCKKGRGGSVWVSGSAGAPSLGRRR